VTRQPSPCPGTRGLERRRLGAAYGLTAVATALVALSCSSPAPLGNQGDPCSAPTDCAANLDCVPQPDGSRVCSNNLGPIVHTEEAGAMDAAMPTGDATVPVKDGGTPQGDSGSPPPPQDSGSPPPPQDSGSPPPPKDSGSPPPQDSGSPPPPPDSGGATD
jgi:hypothetical protein